MLLNSFEKALLERNNTLMDTENVFEDINQLKFELDHYKALYNNLGLSKLTNWSDRTPVYDCITNLLIDCIIYNINTIIWNIGLGDVKRITFNKPNIETLTIERFETSFLNREDYL